MISGKVTSVLNMAYSLLTATKLYVIMTCFFCVVITILLIFWCLDCDTAFVFAGLTRVQKLPKKSGIFSCMNYSHIMTRKVFNRGFSWARPRWTCCYRQL